MFLRAQAASSVGPLPTVGSVGPGCSQPGSQQGFEPEDPGRAELHPEDRDTSGAMDSFLSLRGLKRGWSQEKEGTRPLVLQLLRPHLLTDVALKVPSSVPRAGHSSQTPP